MTHLNTQERMDSQKECKMLPGWMWLLLIFALAYVVFALTYTHTFVTVSKDMQEQAYLENLRHPIKYASPEAILASVWELTNDERVEVTQGAKQ